MYVAPQTFSGRGYTMVSARCSTRGSNRVGPKWSKKFPNSLQVVFQIQIQFVFQPGLAETFGWEEE